MTITLEQLQKSNPIFFSNAQFPEEYRIQDDYLIVTQDHAGDPYPIHPHRFHVSIWELVHGRLRGVTDGWFHDQSRGIEWAVDTIQNLPYAQRFYTFTVTISGVGSDPDEGWIDACQGFALEPGPTPDKYEIGDEI